MNTKIISTADVARIKGRFRYELRDPALPQTTIDDMTALLNSHDAQERYIAQLRAAYDTLAQAYNDFVQQVANGRCSECGAAAFMPEPTNTSDT
jgi:hypothetical protein